MGPLQGIRVVELAGIGPGPMCCMWLADMGAEVLRIDRMDALHGGGLIAPPFDLLARGRRMVALDLKRPEGVAAARRLVARADVLVEGFRPGVAEKLGLGPVECRADHPRLVYGRMTGWGQSGPLSAAAGHDINYLALSGALHAIGRADGPPVPPLNLVADFGGGALYLVAGILAALVERQRSGLGQVVDAAMVDGVAHLLTLFHGLRAAGMWSDERGRNLLDSGAPFYDVYETADGKFVSVGALEPRFFATLARLIDLPAEDCARHMNPREWPQLRQSLASIFRTRTQAEWNGLLEGTDACYAPVLSLAEAPLHPHNAERGTFTTIDGIVQSSAAPRFDRTKPAPPAPVRAPGTDTREALLDWGFTVAEVEVLCEAKIIPATSRLPPSG